VILRSGLKGSPRKRRENLHAERGDGGRWADGAKREGGRIDAQYRCTRGWPWLDKRGWARVVGGKTSTRSWIKLNQMFGFLHSSEGDARRSSGLRTVCKSSARQAPLSVFGFPFCFQSGSRKPFGNQSSSNA
jgi:hypothetical protein